MATYSRHIGEAIPRPSDHISSVLLPGGPRDWRLRWCMIVQRLPNLQGPRSGGRSASTIDLAERDLFEFLVTAYHVKDALIADRAVNEDVVEKAIDNSSILALLADLANLDKHRKPKKKFKPRSKEWPIVESVGGEANSAEAGWHLRVRIQHCGQEHDGVAFATNVVREWTAHLRKWDLI